MELHRAVLSSSAERNSKKRSASRNEGKSMKTILAQARCILSDVKLHRKDAKDEIQQENRTKQKYGLVFQALEPPFRAEAGQSGGAAMCMHPRWNRNLSRLFLSQMTRRFRISDWYREAFLSLIVESSMECLSCTSFSPGLVLRES